MIKCLMVLSGLAASMSLGLAGVATAGDAAKSFVGQPSSTVASAWGAPDEKTSARGGSQVWHYDRAAARDSSPRDTRDLTATSPSGVDSTDNYMRHVGGSAHTCTKTFAVGADGTVTGVKSYGVGCED